MGNFTPAQERCLAAVYRYIIQRAAYLRAQKAATAALENNTAAMSTLNPGQNMAAASTEPSEPGPQFHVTTSGKIETNKG